MGATAEASESTAVLKKVRRTVYEKCIPINATFEITLRCNIRCHHCYNFDRAETYSPPRAGRELATTEITRIIDELAEAGTLYLNLTGGEATLHPDLPEIIRHARRRYMMVKIKTNGTRLDSRLAAEIAQAGACGVDISLYGFSEETYRSFTRIPGAFRRTLRGIDAARDAGLKVRLSIPILKAVLPDLDRMMDFARRNDLPFAADPQITVRYDGSRTSADERLGPDELERLYRGALRPWVRGPNCAPGQAPQCSCGRSTCGISAHGDVYPCIGAPLPAGNLRERSFSEIWRHSSVLNWIRGLKLDDFPVCKPCPHRVYCRRSSGAIYSNTGNYTGAEDWTCMEAAVLHRLHDEGVVAEDTMSSAPGALQRHSFEPN